MWSRKRDKNGKSDNFLEDFQLSESDASDVADAVGEHPHKVFEKGNAPTNKRGDVSWLVCDVFHMRVPGKRHKDVRDSEEDNCFQYGHRHVSSGRVADW